MVSSALCRDYPPRADSYRFISSFRHVRSKTGRLFCCSQSKAIVLYTKTYQVAYTVTVVVFWEMIKDTPCIPNKLAQAVTVLTCTGKVRGSNLGQDTGCGGLLIFLSPPKPAPGQCLKVGHDRFAPHHLQSITVTQSHSHFLTASLTKRTNIQTHNQYSPRTSQQCYISSHVHQGITALLHDSRTYGWTPVGCLHVQCVLFVPTFR
jgi:hypothetical protein